MSTRGQHAVTRCLWVVGCVREVAGKLWGKTGDSTSDSQRALASHNVSSHCWVCFSHLAQETRVGQEFLPHSGGPGKGGLHWEGQCHVRSQSGRGGAHREPGSSWETHLSEPWISRYCKVGKEGRNQEDSGSFCNGRLAQSFHAPPAPAPKL